MRELHLSIILTIVFLVVLFLLLVAFIITRIIFSFKGEHLKDISYKSKNLIVQTLAKGNGKKTLVVLGNGWNVSVNSENKITEHDPFYLIPKIETKLLKRRNYEIVTAYFPFECQGLEQAGQELAQFINEHYMGYKIILIGHSKSGICFANLSKWLNANGKDATIITISAPYGGVKSNEENFEKLGKWQKKIYSKIIVDHKTNDDITMNSEFLLKTVDFSGLSTRNFYNIKSNIPWISFNPITMFLAWADCKFQIIGDGIVGFKEQQSPLKPKREFIINTTHQNSMICSIIGLKKEGVL